MNEATYSVRVGWRAFLLDLLAASIAMVLAYALRFAGEAVNYLLPALPVLLVAIGAQLSLTTVFGLYDAHGQRMWPVRLLAAALIGGVAVGFVAPLVGYEEGVSRQAFGGQAALFPLIGLMWRAWDGLRYRRARRRALRAEFGGEALVEQGQDLASMTGGVTRAWEYRHLLRNLVAKDLKLKYRGSVLGFAWSILIPLLMILVYTVAFKFVMRLDTPRFVLFILIGLLAWNFFAGAVLGATDAITGGGSLLKSVVFPRVVLPFSVVLFHLSQYVLTLAVFLPLMLVLYGVPLAPRMLLFPVFLTLQVMFITGLALALSTATAIFRDVRHLVEVGVGMLFWATPIIYEISMVPEQFQFVALLSPAASYIRAYQDIFFYGVFPDVSIWVVAVSYAVGAFICGLSVFLAYEGRFSELV
jgi:ABC-type polysaccharide/polyol phosphate export permease